MTLSDDMSHGFDNLLSSSSGVLPEIVGPSLLNPNAGREEPAKEARPRMHIHLVNPSDTAFGIGVITPRWLYVLAAATPALHGDPVITDETLERMNFDSIHPGDII